MTSDGSNGGDRKFSPLSLQSLRVKRFVCLQEKHWQCGIDNTLFLSTLFFRVDKRPGTC